jgi:hypothetical protein
MSISKSASKPATARQTRVLTLSVSASARSPGSKETALFTVLVGLDLALWCAMAFGRVNLANAVVVHIGLVVVAVLPMWKARLDDHSLAAFGMLCLLVAGPVGGVGVLAMMHGVSRIKRDDGLLTAWYERISAPAEIDPPAELHEKLVTGRAARPIAAQVRQFANVLREGNDPEQQAMLAFICLRYHPDYHHVLHLALASPMANIRVQAAAIFSKLRERYKVLLKRCLAACDESGLEPQQMLEIAQDLLAALESGFLDSSEASRVRSAARGLLQGLQLSKSTEVPDIEQDLIIRRLMKLDDDSEVISKPVDGRIANPPLELEQRYAKSLRPPDRQAENWATRNHLATALIPQSSRGEPVATSAREAS